MFMNVHGFFVNPPWMNHVLPGHGMGRWGRHVVGRSCQMRVVCGTSRPGPGCHKVGSTRRGNLPVFCASKISKGQRCSNITLSVVLICWYPEDVRWGDVPFASKVNDDPSRPCSSKVWIKHQPVEQLSCKGIHVRMTEIYDNLRFMLRLFLNSRPLYGTGQRPPNPKPSSKRCFRATLNRFKVHF